MSNFHGCGYMSARYLGMLGITTTWERNFIGPATVTMEADTGRKVVINRAGDVKSYVRLYSENGHKICTKWIDDHKVSRMVHLFFAHGLTPLETCAL